MELKPLNLSHVFSQRLDGRFDGIIRQQDAYSLVEKLAQWDDWYIVDPQEEPPEHATGGEEARQHMENLIQEILLEERGVWSTMIYVQSMEDPWIIKVFHPRRAGCGCGGAGGITPWWVFFRLKPERIEAWQPVACTAPPPKKKPWWKKML